MDDKVIKVEFNVWASSEEDGAALKKAIGEFIDWHGQQGRKVSARKLADAIVRWQENPIVRNHIINYFR